MGMNIYTVDGIHIGKRWAAGIWCWDCREQIIEGDVYRCEHIKEWAESSDREVGYNPAMRELGFDKSEPTEHKGIDGASGFIWQVGEYGLGKDIEEIKTALRRRRKVLTEYGEKWEIQKFWDMFKDVITEDSSDYEFS